jgi:hypothetical protein
MTKPEVHFKFSHLPQFPKGESPHFRLSLPFKGWGLSVVETTRKFEMHPNQVIGTPTSAGRFAVHAARLTAGLRLVTKQALSLFTTAILFSKEQLAGKRYRAGFVRFFHRNEAI